MDHGVFNEFFNCAFSVGTCFVLSVLYVASFYVWNSQHNRNHPSTIKKRFFSVFVMMFVSPIFLNIALNENIKEKALLWEVMGLRTPCIIPATILPLVLTMVLFLGPISMQANSGILKLHSQPVFWLNNLRDLIWWRNHVVAPLSEEFTFRACMLPALLQCFQPITAVFICPLFFGVAHFHHMAERINSGLDLKTALIISCFQFFYTTLFGAYSAYLFARTGHMMAPFIAHAFCNHMGFPDFTELRAYQGIKRTFIASLFVLGLVLWCLLLNPLTDPRWYANELFWKV
ncbi:severas [Carabus blaptoides fortunei]